MTERFKANNSRTKTEWSHLPNAEYIDWVIKTSYTKAKYWASVDIVAPQIGATLVGAALETVHNIKRADELHYTWTAIGNAMKPPIGNAIICLVAYDDCAHLIHTDPAEVEVLAKLGSIQASLLLPASILFRETK